MNKSQLFKASQDLGHIRRSVEIVLEDHFDNFTYDYDQSTIGDVYEDILELRNKMFDIAYSLLLYETGMEVTAESKKENE